MYIILKNIKDLQDMSHSSFLNPHVSQLESVAWKIWDMPRPIYVCFMGGMAVADKLILDWQWPAPTANMTVDRFSR